MDNNITILTELLRSVTRLIDPVSSDEKLKWLMDPKIKGEMFAKFPKCAMPIKYLNSENMQPFFFVCNRRGMIDKDMINFSLKACDRLESLNNIDKDHLCYIRSKLKMMMSRYDRETPLAFSSSVHKGKNTRRLNKIINRIRKIRNPSGEIL